MPYPLNNICRSLQTHPIVWLCGILFFLMLGIYLLRFFGPETAQEVETALCLGGFGYSLLHRPWSLLTYFWLHNNMWHLNLNLLLLIFYGRVYLSHGSTSRFFALFLGGGIFGGLGYIAGIGFLASLGVNVLRMPLSGASGSVVALMVATLLLYPRQRFRVKRCSFPLYLLSILFFILIALVSGQNNLGGHLAHLGGVVYGVLFFLWHLIEQKEKEQKKLELHLSPNSQETSTQKALYKATFSGYKSLSSQEKQLLYPHSTHPSTQDKDTAEL